MVSRAGVTHRLEITQRHGEIAFGIDGREVARATDPTSWCGGLLGLRTFRTDLWWEFLKVHSLAGAR